MKVLKFGGSSVASPQTILQVAAIVKERLHKEPLVVVVSAFGGVTDQLIGISQQAIQGQDGYKAELETLIHRHLEAVKALVSVQKQSSVLAEVRFMLNELEDVLQGIRLIRELSPKTADFVQSFGERLSSYIIAHALVRQGIRAQYVDARELILTDRQFGKAQVDMPTSYGRIQDRLGHFDGVPVLGGFISSTPQGETTTLGRGGSDYTGAIVAAALGASVYEVWTDVSGMLTANPRKVAGALPIREISYEEAMELSYFGAKVIYPPSIQPVYAAKIPMQIKNTFAPGDVGTRVTHTPRRIEKDIKGISAIPQIALLTLTGSGLIGYTGVSMRLFSALAQAEINVIFISQSSSEHSISVAVAQEKADLARQVIADAFQEETARRHVQPVQVEKNLCVMAVVGANMRNTPGIAGKLFSALGKNGINVLAVAQGASELNISFVIRESDEAKALNVIHESFFLSDHKVMHLFIVGTGLIGKTLLDQIKAQQEQLLRHQALEIRVVGILNTRQMLLDNEGIDLQNWAAQMETTASPAERSEFVDQIFERNLANSIFVDCTASEAVGDCYELLLQHNVSVVTPNKVVSSGDWNRYQRLKALERKRGVRFLYETNVGAGLPIISTLQDLLHSGDKILSIEAILSGTLNYLCNHVAADRPLSHIVREAQAAGLTEPDPRVDLSGKDVARKILIMVRQMGLPFVLEQVQVQPLVPQACLDAPTPEAFWEVLANVDAEFETKRAAVEARGERMRFVARFAEGVARVGLEAVPADHPFFHAQGSDNIVILTTERYHDLPMVIKGPGAGAAVTAAGVFADIIRLSVGGYQ
ncbi:MAG: bifunctional aspartate kinase/homoserine dehydrogenase I [Bernardetiaceae bacterium]